MNFIDKINTFLKTKNVKLWHILMASLVVNAFALLTLSRGLFIVFLLLTLNLLFLLRLSNTYILYKDDKLSINNKNSSFQLRLKHYTEWFILLTIFIFVNKKYNKKITPIIFLIFSIILLLNLLNYLVIEAISYSGNPTLLKSKIWIQAINYLSNDQLNILQKYTKYFNPFYTAIYLLILITYINYKK